MTKNISWKGSYYQRVRSNDYRNRNTGDIVSNVKLQKRKGMRNRTLVWNGKNWIGIEKTYHHVYSRDPKRLKGAKILFQRRVRSRAEQKAIHAKLRRR